MRDTRPNRCNALQTTPDGYRATAGIKLSDGRLQLWQDAKVWSE
jgi:hypothetical protein